jgi:hypothetical protein
MQRIANSKLFIEQEDSVIANLKLQFDYDRISKPAFFNIIIKAYLERDPRILSLLDENNKKPRSKEKSDKDEKEFRETEKQFGLNENDIENIFDIISKENSEL